MAVGFKLLLAEVMLPSLQLDSIKDRLFMFIVFSPFKCLSSCLPKPIQYMQTCNIPGEIWLHCRALLRVSESLSTFLRHTGDCYN